MSQPTSFPSAIPDGFPSELESNGAFVRNLARSLVRNAADADDLGQETWLAGLRHEARDGALDPSRERGWFQTVMRRRRATLLRGNERRRGRETAVAKGDFVQSAAETAATMEVAELLLSTVRNLDEPVRTAVVARYYEGLSFQAIGQRESTPASTIRSRVERGLSQLREELDRREPTGREGWLSGVAGLAAPALSGGGAGKTSGLLVWCGVAAAAVAFAVVTWQRAPKQAASETLELASLAPTAPQESVATAEAIAPLTSVAGQASREAGKASAPEGTQVIDESAHVISGRVIDADGKPVVGARLWISAQPPRPTGSAWDLIAKATTAKGGRFKLTLPSEWLETPRAHSDISVLVLKEGSGTFHTMWAPDEVPAGMAFEPRLAPIGSSEFTILKESGEPYQGARVLPTALKFPDRSGQRISADVWKDLNLVVTDESGHVTLPFARTAILGLEVEPASGGRFEVQWGDNQGGPFPTTLTLAEPVMCEFEGIAPAGEQLEVEAQCSIFVPTSGARHLLATLKVNSEIEGGAPWSLAVPGDSAYLVVDRLGPNASHHIARASQGGEGPWKLETKTSPVRRSLLTHPPATAWIEGIAVAENGDPAQGAWVTAARSGENRNFQVTCAVAGADGRFSLGPVSADATYELMGHLGELTGRSLGQGAERSEGETASQPPSVRLVLSTATFGRARFAWTGEEPVPRLRTTLVSEEVLTVTNWSGVLVAGGKLEHATDIAGAVMFQRALEPGARYAIRYEGWSEEDRARVVPGLSPFFTTEEFKLEATFWGEPRGSLRGSLPLQAPKGAGTDSLRVRPRSSAYWSPVSASGEYTLTSGELDSDVLLVERNGVMESAELLLGVDAKPLDESGGPPSPKMAVDLLWPMVQAELEAGGENVAAVLQPLMYADPDGVLAFLDAGTCKDEVATSRWLRQLVESMASTRPKDALVLAERDEVFPRYAYVAYLAVPGLSRADATQTLERAMESVGQIEHTPWRLSMTSLVIRRFLELGESDVAEALLDNALLEVSELPTDGDGGFAHSDLGTALCALDVERGLELIDSTEPRSQRERMKGKATAWIAAANLDAAEKLLAELKKGQSPAFYIDRSLPSVAYHLARQDAARALATVARYEGSSVSHGLVALALAERGETNEAREVLRAAFDRFVQQSDVYANGYLHPITSAAFLLCMAKVVDPQGLEEWQHLALSLPRKAVGAKSPNHQALAVAEGTLAIALSASRPELAQVILQPWLEALHAQTPLGNAARMQATVFAAAVALCTPTQLEARIAEAPADLHGPMLRAGAMALARSAEPRGKLLAALNIFPGAWWPGEDAY